MIAINDDMASHRLSIAGKFIWRLATSQYHLRLSCHWVSCMDNTIRCQDKTPSSHHQVIYPIPSNNPRESWELWSAYYTPGEIKESRMQSTEIYTKQVALIICIYCDKPRITQHNMMNHMHWCPNIWQENAFCKKGLLWWTANGHRWIPFSKGP